MKHFELVSDFPLKGDQPKAVAALTEGLLRGDKFQTLLGVTGSGKTFTMANVIARLNRPTLVIAHNKTLAAQLTSEFREFFPKNAVEYFVSYYDYYQPEAYVPQSDTYIAKDASINDELDRLRHAATQAVLTRRDVIVVASVSCIYGLGSPEEYAAMMLRFQKGDVVKRTSLLHSLVDIHYARNDMALARGTFRVRGDALEVFPADEERIYRICLSDNTIERLAVIDPLTGEVLEERDEIAIFPATHYVTPWEKLEFALRNIEDELEERLAELRAAGKLLEAERLEQRTRYDLEMIREVGYCSGIENYSRHLDMRLPGTHPSTLIEYFPKDFIIFVDESHQTIPQLRAMYKNDRTRKETLVNFGFRLPSALDNRPLTFEELESYFNQVVFVSATPGPYEFRQSEGRVVEQIVRPTGLIDPEIEVRPTKGQIDDLISEIQSRAQAGERTLVTTLTKRMAEDLTNYLTELNIKVHYLHSEVHTLQRTEILRDLRLGVYDVVVGVNLLREGLDLPEVTLVAILDADKEGFLRSETSLIQTVGRAARHVNGKVIMYGDTITGSMQRALDETRRRRTLQVEFNQLHGIVPQTIQKEIRELLVQPTGKETRASGLLEFQEVTDENAPQFLKELEAAMRKASQELRFEEAAAIRDKLVHLRKRGKQEFTAEDLAKELRDRPRPRKQRGRLL
jgi:excinuclease ABC subunit B